MLVVTGNRTNSRLAPFSFPKRQNSSSPLSTSNSDSEPISENLDAIRAQLLKQQKNLWSKNLILKDQRMLS